MFTKNNLDMPKRLLALAIALGDEEEFRPHRGLTTEDFLARVALWIKGIHTFHAILEIAPCCMPSPTQVLTRSLIETSLTQEFLCRHSIRLWEVKNKKKSPLDLFGRRLTRHFRTSLYLAHCRIEDRRQIESCGNFGGRGWKKTLAFVQRECDEFESDIGAQWMRRLENTRSYSGLSIRQLAVCLGKRYRDVYDVLYRAHSRSSHASDPMLHVQLTADGDLTAVEPEMELLLEQATSIFVEIMQRFYHVFHITEAQGHALVELLEEYADS